MTSPRPVTLSPVILSSCHLVILSPCHDLGDDSSMSTDVLLPEPLAPLPEQRPPTPRHYLNVRFGVASWLLTLDHKRIAILYMVSITLMFFIGGAAATLIRIELATPIGDVVDHD